MRLFAWELRKLWGDQAARVGFVVVAAVLSVALAVIALSEPREIAIPEGTAGREIVLATHDTHNGWNFAISLLMPMAGLLIPGIVLVALSGTVAGEAERRTITEPICRGVRRGSLVIAKIAAGTTYAFALVALTAVVSVGIAPLVLGTGPIVPLGRTGTLLGSGDLLAGGGVTWRLAGAYLAAFVGLAPVAALAVLASVVAETARNAAVAGIGVFYSLTALSALPGVAVIRPYLLVDHLTFWRGLLSVDVPWGRLAYGGGVIALAFVLLSAAAVLVFSGRDLSSGSHSAR